MIKNSGDTAPNFYVFAPNENEVLKVLNGWIELNDITETSGITTLDTGCSIFSPTPPSDEEETEEEETTEEESVTFAVETSEDFEGEECGEFSSWPLQVIKHYCPPGYKCEIERTQWKNGYCCPAGTNIQEGAFSNTCVYE